MMQRPVRRKPSRTLALFVGLALLPLALAWAGSVRAQSPLKIRGASNLEAAATPVDDGLAVRGLLRDDAGRGIGNAHIHVELRDGQNGSPLRLPAAQACPPSPALHEARGFADLADEYVVDTDAAGAFCVRMSDARAPSAAAAPPVLRLWFDDPARLLDGSERRVELDSARRTLELGFSQLPAVLPLERAAHGCFVETRLRPVLDREPALPIRIALRIAEPGLGTRELGFTEISAGERAEFRIDRAALGSPGPATLIAAFTGSNAVQPAETRAIVMRTAVVMLEAPPPLPPVDPSEGTPVRVRVHSSSSGAPSGTVEARLGSETVGIASLRAGAADLVVAFQPGHDRTSAELELRYLPDAPWWVPGPPQRLTIHVRPPSPWRRLPWLLAALAVAAWVVASWRRPVRTERPTKARPAARPPRPAIRLVEASERSAGWTGRVLDAHDGTPIARAEIVVRQRVFQGDGVAASTASDGEGRFALPPLPDPVEQSAIIEVQAPWHSRFSADLPAPGVVVLELVSRRRALIERLVEWAANKGSPWTDAGEPTPGHVAKTAERERISPVARWARATEEAAYGPNPPDDVAEERVRATEPEREARGEERAH
jgi:hypothetical protein